MNESIGFVLVTHNNPEQVVYLCSCLSEKFGNPPIALHHDFSQSSLPREQLGDNVFVVENFLHTRWGDLSVVEAFLSATRLLFSKSRPQWVVNLSSADYPIKAAEQIQSELLASPFDAMFGHYELRYGHLASDHVRDDKLGFADPAYAEMGYDRYVAIRIIPARIYQNFPSLKRLNVRGLAAESLSPFSKQLRPFGGPTWLTFNARAATAFLEDSVLLQRLLKYYAGHFIPDESLPHTLLCGWPGLKVANIDLRYVDWSLGEPHPKQLGREDIPAMLASGAHFARKFSFDPDLYEAIDHAIAEHTTK